MNHKKDGIVSQGRGNNLGLLAPAPEALKREFLLDDQVIFLNHGSFGACPKPVFEVYQEWQRRLERQPVQFLLREYSRYDLNARQSLGDYLNANPKDLVFIPNATHGVNIIARCLHLEPGDEILATDHEYGACDYTWQYMCEKRRAVYRRQPISLPISSAEEIAHQIWRGVNQRTKLIFLSHITSPTAIRLPVEILCQKAQENGIPILIDGAHAPGQIPVDLATLGADFYTGNCHKWMLAPKGSAFLYARNDVQPSIEPLVVSWGYHATAEFATGSQFTDYLQWTGTKDPAASLTAPRAIQFMQENHWDQVQHRCHGLLRQAIERISNLVDLPPLYPLDSGLYAQMGIAPIPKSNLPVLKSRLYDEYKVEVPLVQWQDRHFVRISIQGYNTQEDIEGLIGALSHLLPQVAC